VVSLTSMAALNDCPSRWTELCCA